MPVVQLALPLILISLLSCCVAEEVIMCPAGICICRYIDKDGIPQLLSNCTQADLQDLPQGLDSSTTALDMSDNNITRLQNDTFERTGILHLDRVFFNHNNIVRMESGAFRKLSSLSELHLESNLITSILPGTFWGNPKLVVLNLRNNRLSSLPVDIATFKNHIQELDISDNGIQKVDTYLVQRYYPELRRLDVSRNQISRIFSTSPLDNSSLEVVDASYNYIAELDPSTFSSASNLKELNVSNNKINTLSEDVFARNPELVRVDLSNNHILIIHRDAFRMNPKIREIYAGSNSMTYLHPDTFSKNPKLTQITVSWNRIKDIHPQTFYNNPDLEFLDFSNNKLQTLNSDVFQNNPSLRLVDLSSNSLVDIHDTTFHHNPGLEYLYLSKNKHIRVHNGLLILASSLKVFDAQHCNLSHLPLNFFKNTTNLREMLLGNNNFTSMDCVSNTDSDDYVNSLTELRVIDLSNNQLQTIDVEVFKSKTTQLKSLRIEGNPFLCDCKLRNVWLWSQEVGIIPRQPQITCTDMERRPVPWDEVEHMHCNDESLAEESESRGTYIEESSSAVGNTHIEQSTSAVTYMLTEESESRGTYTEESSSAVGNTHIEQSTSAITYMLTEESTSTGTRADTEEATSTVGGEHREAQTSTARDTNTEILTSAVAGMHTGESTSTITGTQTEELTSTVGRNHPEESTATSAITHSDLSTEPQHANLSESNAWAVSQVEEIHVSAHEGRKHDSMILMGVLLFFILVFGIAALLLVFYVKRRYGIYEVSNAKVKKQSKTTDVRVPADDPQHSNL